MKFRFRFVCFFNHSVMAKMNNSKYISFGFAVLKVSRLLSHISSLTSPVLCVVSLFIYKSISELVAQLVVWEKWGWRSWFKPWMVCFFPMCVKITKLSAINAWKSSKIPKFSSINTWKSAKIPKLTAINTWKSAKIPKLSAINAWKCATKNINVQS